MTALDATGLHAIEKLTQRLRASGRMLLLCGARDQPAKLIESSALSEERGRENILPNVDAALERARFLHGSFDGVGPDLTAEFNRALA